MNRFLSLLAALGIFCLPGLPVTATAASLMEDIQTGYSLLDQWQIDRAEALTDSLLKAYPESGDVLFLHARVQFYKGRYDFAWKILQRVSDDDRLVREFKSLVKQTRSATADFVSRESDHFIFRFVEGSDEVLLPYAREVLETSYNVLGDLFNLHPQDKVVVEIYPGREPFSRISPLTMKDIVTSGTVALCKYNRLMMISPSSLVRGYNWMDTLSHEYIHFLLAGKTHNNVPLWLNEGIAKYFESRWRGEEHPLDPIMETVLARGLENDYLIGLDEMMPSLAKLKNAEDVQLAYSEVATMVDFLVKERGEAFLTALMTDLATAKTPFSAVLEKRSGQDIISFQSQWKQYVLKKKLKIIPGLKVLSFKFKSGRAGDEAEEKDYSEIDNKDARDFAFLGDILKSRNHMEAAVIEYQKALKDSPTLSPILHNKLAGTYILTKQYDLAETLLKESLRYYPHFHTTLTHLGEVYFQSENYDLAEKYFEQAVRINPFNPLVHQRLIKIKRLTGKPREAELQLKLYRYIK